jgi:HPt (histidine-containing phosphotransfer) domain-containing protein
VTLKSDFSPADSQPSPRLDVALGLEMLGDEESLAELLELALQGLERDIPAVAQHLSQGDAKGANQLLHAIKGFAPIFCCPELVQQITAVEALSKTASAAEITPLYAQLAPGLSQLRDEICVHLGRTPGGGGAP